MIEKVRVSLWDIFTFFLSGLILALWGVAYFVLTGMITLIGIRSRAFGRTSRSFLVYCASRTNRNWHAL